MLEHKMHNVANDWMGMDGRHILVRSRHVRRGAYARDVKWQERALALKQLQSRAHKIGKGKADHGRGAGPELTSRLMGRMEGLHRSSSFRSLSPLLRCATPASSALVLAMLQREGLCAESRAGGRVNYQQSQTCLCWHYRKGKGESCMEGA